jgi:hypothetical protein
MESGPATVFNTFEEIYDDTLVLLVSKIMLDARLTSGGLKDMSWTMVA